MTPNSTVVFVLTNNVDNSAGARSWTWQTCSEAFGFFQTTDVMVDTIFGPISPLKYSLLWLNLHVYLVSLWTSVKTCLDPSSPPRPSHRPSMPQMPITEEHAVTEYPKSFINITNVFRAQTWLFQMARLILGMHSVHWRTMTMTPPWFHTRSTIPHTVPICTRRMETTLPLGLWKFMV